MLLWSAVSCWSGCAPVRTSNAAVCRIRFDWTDAGLEGLDVQNLRALAAWKAVCRQ